MNEFFKLVKSNSLPLTKELAEQFANMAASPTERELDPKRVKHLRTKVVDQGLATPFQWSKAKMPDGKWVRMNGQHSSTMLSGLNGDFPEGLAVHIDEYEVTERDGLALLFRQFDDRKSSRTPSDVAGAYAGLYTTITAEPRFSKLAIEGVHWYRDKIQGTVVPAGDDVYTMFKEERLHPFINWVGEIFSTKTPEMFRKEIAGAMYATFCANEEKAKNFWHITARGGMDYQEDHPTTVLSQWLQAAKKHDSPVKFKPADYYYACVYCWNADMDDRTLNRIVLSKAKEKGIEPKTGI